MLIPHPESRSFGVARLVARNFLLVAALSLTGCNSLINTAPDLQTPRLQQVGYIEPSDDLPIPVMTCQQNQVHIFLIHGLDPFDLANLRGLRNHCHQLGYRQTTLAQFFHGPQVVSRVCAIKSSDPSAKILLFGFSAGTLTTRTVANTLHSKHGIDVDVVVYTSGITMLDREYNHPKFVGKVIHVRDRSWVGSGIELSNAENHKYKDAWHFGTASHENTMLLMRRELDRLALETPITLPPTLPHATMKVESASVTPSTWDVARPSESLLPPPRFIAK